MPETVVPIVKANSVLVLDSVNYDVIAGPGESTPLVQVAREQILQTIEIDKLVRNLNRTDDLLHIAACGVAGFLNPNTGESLSAQVMSLQYKLRDNTGEMRSALLSFRESAGKMIPILRDAFKDLYSFYESDSIERLQQCEEVAKEMAATSDALKGTFKGLADEAQKIAQDTQTTKDVREQARKAAIAKQNEIEAQDAEMQTIKESLQAQIPQVKGWYEEAKAAQNTADGRMFALAITGAITKALGDGLAAGLQFKTAPVTAGTQLAAAIANKAVPPAKEEKKTDEKSKKTSEVLTAQAAYRVAKDALTQAEEKYTAAQEKTKEAQDALDELDDGYKEARDAYEAAKKKKPADKKDLAVKKDAFEELKGPYEEAETALEEATEEEEKAKTACEEAQEKEKTAKATKDEADANAPLAGVAAGLSSAGASAQDAATAYADIAANYGKEKTKYLDMLMQLQDQERKALGAISKFAVQMQTEKGNEQLEQASVESLHIAVGVLKHLVVILQDVTQFWTQMAAACRGLASTDLRASISSYMKRPRDERVLEYSAPDFKLRMLTVAAQWHALKLVTNEYRTEVSQVFTKLGETYKQNLPIQEARAEAKRLSALLDADVKKEIQKSNETTAQIKTAIAETVKLVAVA